ncbi:MAG: fluoride efflux transporter CrcB [Bacteroidales bacterium]
MKNILLVAFGGGMGSVARYLLSLYFVRNTYGGFPLATLVVNVIGCLLIGLLFGLAERGELLSSELRLLLAVGFCGGFTTFSTFSNETFVLVRGGQIYSALFYIGLSVLLGFFAVVMGYKLITLIR